MEETKFVRRRVWPFILACVFIPLILIAACLWHAWQANDYTLQITLEGDRQITLPYGTAYADAGASARFWGSVFHTEPVAVEVTQTGSVDTQTLGSYTIRYEACYGNYVGTAYRTVHIVDTQAPVITLITDPAAYTLPGQIYQEEGFTATDDHDGDLTALVSRVDTGEKVIYTVCDSAGNKTQVERPIVYNDPIPPEIAIVGESYITISAGSAYHDLGAVAMDNCDGDITGRITVSGGVDRYLPGTYYITYSVKDSYENEVSVTRTVCVTSFQIPEEVMPNGKVIYLTFDDGPGPHTDRLLDVLAKYNVKATFFVVNTAYIGTVSRIAAEGHAVGIHTRTHNFDEIYASEDAYFADLNYMQQVITEKTGNATKLVRFPGGSSNTVSSFNPGIMTRLTQAVHAQGYQYFDWNVDSYDAGGARSANTVFHNVTGGIGDKNASVVLQHDIKGFSVDAVEKIIIWGLSNGYTFLPLDVSSPGCHHRVNN